MSQKLMLIKAQAFQSTCDCGWKAPKRDSFLKALDDGDAHEFLCPDKDES